MRLARVTTVSLSAIVCCVVVVVTAALHCGITPCVTALFSLIN